MLLCPLLVLMLRQQGRPSARNPVNPSLEYSSDYVNPSLRDRKLLAPPSKDNRIRTSLARWRSLKGILNPEPKLGPRQNVPGVRIMPRGNNHVTAPLRLSHQKSPQTRKQKSPNQS